MKEMTKETQMELQMLDMQARSMSEQLEKVDSGLMELDYLKTSLDDLKKTKEGSAILAPLSNGIFLKAKLEKNDELLVNVGNEVVAVKNVADTKAMLDERIEEMKGIKEELLQRMQHIEKRLVDLDKKNV